MVAVNPYQRVQDAPDWNQSTFADGDVPKWNAASGKYISGGGAAGGGDNHKSVRVATTAAGTLSTSFANGQTVDGKTLVTGDRILIKNQASAVENGIYVVAASGAPARASDLAAASSAAEVFVFVREGTVNVSQGFVCTSLPGSDVVGTNNLTWQQFTGGAGTVHATLSGLSADDHTQYILAAGTRAFAGAQSMGSNKLTNLATPTATTDAANKQYVDGVAAGLKVHPTCRVATTAAQTLSTDFAAGQTIDGVTLATSDRVLVKNQATGSENGIYVVGAGAPTRAADLAAASSAAAVFVFITSGTTNIGTGWVCTNASGSDVVGTNALTFTQFSGFGSSGGGGGGTLSGLESRARPWRNFLVNGSFGQFQRRSGVAAITCNDDTYGCDCWYALTQLSAVTLLQLTGSGTRSKSSAQWAQAFGAGQRFGMAQIVEAADSIPLRSRSFTFQGRLNLSASALIRFAVLEWTGTADAVTSDVVNNWSSSTFTSGGGNFFIGSLNIPAIGSITPATTTWTDFSVTGTFSSGVTNAILFIWTDASQALNWTMELEAVGLFDGPVTRDWLPEPESLNLRRCERFLRVVESATGMVTGTNGAYVWVPHPGMIAAPAASITGNLTGIGGGNGSFASATQSSGSITNINATKDGSQWQINNLSPTMNIGYPFALNPSGSTARILLDASL